MRKGPTIKDVAERAGVSRGTVDRVINGRGYVYRPVHERVLKAIDELRFPTDQIDVVETHNDYHTTYRMVTESLKENPDLAAIYMVNQSVLGCAQALDAAEKTGKVRVVVHDMSDGTRMLLQSGRIDFTISQDFCRQGYLPLKCLRERIHLRK